MAVRMISVFEPVLDVPVGFDRFAITVSGVSEIGLDLAIEPYWIEKTCTQAPDEFV